MLNPLSSLILAIMLSANAKVVRQDEAVTDADGAVIDADGAAVAEAAQMAEMERLCAEKIQQNPCPADLPILYEPCKLRPVTWGSTEMRCTAGCTREHDSVANSGSVDC